MFVITSSKFPSTQLKMDGIFFVKAEISPFKKDVFISFNEIPLKMMKNVIYLMLKVYVALEILKYLSWFFGFVEKQLHKKVKVNFRNYDVADCITNNHNTYIIQYLKK